MYRLLRNTHLLLGLFVAASVLIYGVSSVQMVHREWLPWKNQTIERTVPLPPKIADPRDVARALMQAHQVWGDLNQVTPADAGFRLRIARPGEATDAAYDSATGRTRLRIQRSDFAGMLVHLHHAHGVDHESLSVNLWGFLVGFVSLALMTLGATGVYLWFRIHQERLAGGLILAVSLAFSLALLLLSVARQDVRFK